MNPYRGSCFRLRHRQGDLQCCEGPGVIHRVRKFQDFAAGVLRVPRHFCGADRTAAPNSVGRPDTVANPRFQLKITRSLFRFVTHAYAQTYARRARVPYHRLGPCVCCCASGCKWSLQAYVQCASNHHKAPARYGVRYCARRNTCVLGKSGANSAVYKFGARRLRSSPVRSQEHSVAHGAIRTIEYVRKIHQRLR